MYNVVNGPVVHYYTAGQFREGQRAAVLADRLAQPPAPEGQKLAAGAMLANTAYNWAQRPGYTLTKYDCAMLDMMQKQ